MLGEGKVGQSAHQITAGSVNPETGNRRTASQNCEGSHAQRRRKDKKRTEIGHCWRRRSCLEIHEKYCVS